MHFYSLHITVRARLLSALLILILVPNLEAQVVLNIDLNVGESFHQSGISQTATFINEDGTEFGRMKTEFGAGFWQDAIKAGLSVSVNDYLQVGVHYAHNKDRFSLVPSQRQDILFSGDRLSYQASLDRNVHAIELSAQFRILRLLKNRIRTLDVWTGIMLRHQRTNTRKADIEWPDSDWLDYSNHKVLVSLVESDIKPTQTLAIWTSKLHWRWLTAQFDYGLTSLIYLTEFTGPTGEVLKIPEKPSQGRATFMRWSIGLQVPLVTIFDKKD